MQWTAWRPMAPLGRKIRFRVKKAVVGEGYPKLAMEAS